MTPPPTPAHDPLGSPPVVVRGDPTPEELAAVLTVLTAVRSRTTVSETGAPAPVSLWSLPSRALRPARSGTPPVDHRAPDAWRTSTWPH